MYAIHSPNGHSPLVVGRDAAHLVVSLEQRFGKEGTDMAAPQSVHHAPSVAGCFDQAGEAELGQVLAGDRGSTIGDLGQGGYVEVLLPQGPQNANPGWIGEQRERQHCGIDLLGGQRVGMAGCGRLRIAAR